MIEFKDVTKEYSKGIAALNGVNLKIEKGEFAFIVGDSGSGKSTLIRLLLKELDPTSGSIIVNGQNLNTSETQEDSTVPETSGGRVPGFPSVERPEHL